MNKRYWALICLLAANYCLRAQSFDEVVINQWQGAFPNGMVVFNDSLFFSASDSLSGYEPWVSGGPADARQIEDIFVGTGNSFPLYFTPDSNLYLFFQANDSVHGQELWAYNTDSTYLVKDINPGTDPSLPQNLFVFNHKLYFQADDGVHGSELWVSNGTADSTYMLKDINTAESDSAGSFPSGFTVYNGKLYFNAADSAHGYELWVTDGTTNGTQLVMDIWPGATGSNPTGLTVFNSALYFSANDSIHGNELWVTNGTVTELDRDINPGYQSSNPQGFTSVNSRLLFQADDGVHGPELCSIDGMQVGYQLVSDIYTGTTGSYPQNFYPYNGKLFFQATDSVDGAELWTTDGSPSGTHLLSDLNPGPDGSYPAYFTPYHNKLYFIAQPDSVSGAQMFVTDGTLANTNDIVFNGGPLNPLGSTNGFTVLGNNMAFSAYYDPNYGQQLWYFNDGPTGIPQIETPAFKLYPNPCRDYYMLSGFNIGDNYTLRLTDLTGRTIQLLHTQASSTTMQFYTPQAAAGVYLLQVQNNQSATTLRLVKSE